jgi:hypothetical protein
MAAPTAAAKDLNDRANLGLIKWSDWHCLRGRDEGKAGTCDKGGRDKLLHDRFSQIRDEGTLIEWNALRARCDCGTCWGAAEANIVLLL